ncbi:MAG: NAD(P)/FAD-dependent oxidoreductase [Candidatus Hodarchaeota archaeon]
MPKEHQTDILVIGGGPAGSLAAYHAAKQGCKTLLVEEHKEAGVPDHCAGLIGIQGLERLLNPIPANIIQNYISKANLVSPEGNIFSVVKKNSMLVVNRAQLDQKLLQRAVDKGTELLTGIHIKQLIVKNRQVCGAAGLKRSTKEEQLIHAKVVINAEGARARLIKQAGLISPSRDWFLPALQYEFNTPSLDPDVVHLCFGKSWAPGFFAWIIPFSDERVRVGVGVKREYGPPKMYLDRFIKKHPVSSLFNFSSPIRRFGGVISAAGPIPQTYNDGFLVVGDAAGQTKPTSGGGVNIGGYCGKLAGEVAAKSIQAQNYSQKFLRNYQKLWKRYFERELTLMRIFRRRIAGTISDELLEQGFKTAIASGIQRKLADLQDVDLHLSGFFKSVLTPSFVLLGVKKLPNFIKTFLAL